MGKKQRLFLSVLGLSLHSMFSAAQTLPPANDNFANRAPLHGFSASVQGTTTYGTREPLEPFLHEGTGSNSVWWSWSSPLDGPVTLTATWSNPHTNSPLLAVFTGGDLASLGEITVSRMFQLKKASQVTFTATRGTEYQIVVDAVAGEVGDFTLTLLPAAPPSLFVASPPNGAVFITDSKVHFAGWATNDEAPALNCQLVSDFLIYATVTPQASGAFVMDAVLPGGTNIFQVTATDAHGVTAWSPPLAISLHPQNDSFTNALVLSGSKPKQLGTVSGATLEPGEQSFCGSGSVWYAWTAPFSGPVRMNISVPYYSSGGPAITVFTGESLTNLSLVASNQYFYGDGNTVGAYSQIDFDAVLGKEYRIAVGTGLDDFEQDYHLPDFALFIVPVSVVGAPNSPPVVQIVNPVDGEHFPGPTNVQFTVEVADPDGEVYVLQLYRDGDYSKGFVNTNIFPEAPLYPTAGFSGSSASITIEGVLTNTTLMAVATDNLGLRTTNSVHISADFSPPPNDNFADRVPLVGCPLVVTGYNLGATSEPGEPLLLDGISPNASVWWSWTATNSGPVTVNASANFDSVAVMIYTNSSLGSLGMANGSLFGFSQWHLEAASGTTYQISLNTEAWNYASLPEGMITLSIQPTPVATLDSPADGAVFVAGQAVPFRGHAEALEGLKDVYLELAPGPSGSDQWRDLGTNGEFSVDFVGVAPGRYAATLWVYGALGSVNFAQHTVVVRPTNDNFTNAGSLNGYGDSVTGSGGTTTEPGEPELGGQPAENSAWWIWTAPADGTVTVTAGSFGVIPSPLPPLRLGLYTGDSLSTLVPVPLQESQAATGGIPTAQAWFLAQAGTQYRIAVDEWSYYEANYSLSIRYASPPTVKILTPAPNALVDANKWVPVVISVGASDSSTPLASSVTLYIDDYTWDSKPLPSPLGGEVTFPNVSIAAGTHQLRATVTDWQGLVGSATPVTVTGYQPPISVMVSPQPFDATHHFQFQISGEQGQTAYIESSEDLVHWALVDTIYLDAPAVTYTDFYSPSAAQRCYRATPVRPN